jgi:hypothetical protein
MFNLTGCQSICQFDLDCKKNSWWNNNWFFLSILLQDEFRKRNKNLFKFGVIFNFEQQFVFEVVEKIFYEIN